MMNLLINMVSQSIKILAKAKSKLKILIINLKMDANQMNAEQNKIELGQNPFKLNRIGF